MNSAPSTLVKTVLPIVVLGVLGSIAMLIWNNPPANERGQRPPSQLVVEVIELKQQDYSVKLQSYGTIQPRTQSMLVSQVAGQIVEINPAFRDGGFFEAGETLIQIDDRDYRADVKIAEAGLLEARQALAEAEARSQQALLDWQRLGNSGEPPPLVRREPQLQAARARVASAEAAVSKARLDVSRAVIQAPFAGRVLRQTVDLGQVVSVNTTLGEIYATDIVEVRLPLRNVDLRFIELPEQFRFDANNDSDGAVVLFESDLGDGGRWRGQLVRTEGAIDPTARQLYVAAQIKDPYARNVEGTTPLKIGQYVTASIDGKTLPNAIVIANENIYQGTYVYVVENGVLDRRTVDVTWQNDIESIVADGVLPGEQLVTTPLGQVTSGTRVTIAGAAEKDRRDAGGRTSIAGAGPAGRAAQ